MCNPLLNSFVAILHTSHPVMFLYYPHKSDMMDWNRNTSLNTC